MHSVNGLYINNYCNVVNGEHREILPECLISLSVTVSVGHVSYLHGTPATAEAFVMMWMVAISVWALRAGLTLYQNDKCTEALMHLSFVCVIYAVHDQAFCQHVSVFTA